MTYELDKKLKDAGFKQEGKGNKLYTENLTEYALDTDMEREYSNAYEPTLEELIEQLPIEHPKEKGYFLSIYPSLNGKTIAGYDDSYSMSLFSEGISMKEALANLYLKLHEK